MKVPHSCKRDDWKGVPLAEVDPSLFGKKIAIVGYSARALNYVAKTAGMQTIVLDCFADMDLRRSADEFLHVNLDLYRNSEGNLENTAAFYLNQEMQKNLHKITELDFLVLGSSFENDFDAWTNASKVKNYIGNRPLSAKNVRETSKIYPFLIENSISFPKTVVFHEREDGIDYVFYHGTDNSNIEREGEKSRNLEFFFEKVCEIIPLPFILKSETSGGGLGIFMIDTEQEFVEKMQVLKKLRNPPYLIQQYIQGIPMSFSFLSDGIHANVHTISEQIIGETRFGCKGRFTYCGNIMNKEISDPANEKNKEITPELEKIAQKLTEFGSLKGSNGIDFIISKTGDSADIHFIELNPRFQGTIDLVLASTGENLLQYHIKSIKNGTLPNEVCFPDENTYMKVIYYSPLDFHILVDLQGLEFRDVPLIGSFIPSSSPICSNIVIGKNYEDTFDKALNDRDLMIRVLGLKSRISKQDSILLR